MASLTRWPLWLNLSKLWKTVKDREAWWLQSTGSQRVRHSLQTEWQQQSPPRVGTVNLLRHSWVSFLLADFTRPDVNVKTLHWLSAVDLAGYDGKRRHKGVTVLTMAKLKRSTVILSRLDRQVLKIWKWLPEWGQKETGGLEENAWLENGGEEAGRIRSLWLASQFMEFRISAVGDDKVKCNCKCLWSAYVKGQLKWDGGESRIEWRRLWNWEVGWILKDKAQL